MTDYPKCEVCGALATVFLTEVGSENREASFCELHGRSGNALDIFFDSTELEKKIRALVELREFIRSASRIPIDMPFLPSKLPNPIYGLADLQSCTVEELLEWLEEFDERVKRPPADS